MSEQSADPVRDSGERGTPVRLCCGQRHSGAVCPDEHFMCCLCFDRFPVEQASVEYGFAPYLEFGQKQDVCWPCAWMDGPAQLLTAMARLSASSPARIDGSGTPEAEGEDR